MPVKMLHFADIHLGVENYGKINPGTGLNSRFEDFARTLERVVDYAIQNGVHLAVFAGDAYKNRDPSPTHQRTFATQLRRLSSAGIPTVVLVGNHDVPNTRGRAHAVEVFRVLDVPLITVADIPRVHRIETSAGPVQVIALPYRRASLLAEQEGLRGKTQAEMGEAVVESYDEQMQLLCAQLDQSIPTVLAAHLAVGGASVGSERSMMLSDEPIVPLSTLARAGECIDYVALGHMHKHQNLNPRSYPPVIYCGSLERIDFGEEDDPKGFVIVNLEREKTTYEFVEVGARPFITLECDLSTENPAEELEAKVRQMQVAGAIVRLRYKVPEDRKMHVTTGQINRLLADAFCVGRVERQFVRAQFRQRDPGLTDSVDTLNALERYLQIKPPKVSQDDLLAFGKRLIDELKIREEAL